MNNIIFQYIVKNFLKTFFSVFMIFYCFGLILNLFEEIEFFKNTNVNIFFPLQRVYITVLLKKLEKTEHKPSNQITFANSPQQHSDL